MAATSFYPTRNLGAMGDGGALLCNDGNLAQRACALRNYGQTAQYIHDERGLNSRLDELQAAILHDALVPKLAEWTERRSAIATRYLQEIANPQITLLRPLAGMTPVWHLFPMLVAPEQRENFRATLGAFGITIGIHYPHIIPQQAALLTYKRFCLAKPLPTAERFAREEVSLPINPLLTEDEVTRVVEACNRWNP
jgi:dTDP-4-amino-4,6-dideoxygalactose transaminase